jgi:hypothetical protein
MVPGGKTDSAPDEECDEGERGEGTGDRGVLGPGLVIATVAAASASSGGGDKALPHVVQKRAPDAEDAPQLGQKLIDPACAGRSSDS